MSDEIKYCKFCNKEKPIKEFIKSGFAIKNICRECQIKKQAQIYRDSKKVKELEKENQELKADYGTKAQVERDLLMEENQELKKQLKIKHDGFMASVEESCELAEENQKYKEVIDKIRKIIYEIDELRNTTGGYPSNYIDDLLSILKEVKHE